MRKIGIAAIVLIGCAVGATISAVVSRVGFLVFFYEMTASDYREMILEIKTNGMGVIGAVVGGLMSAIPKARLMHAAGLILVSLVVITVFQGSEDFCEIWPYWVLGVVCLVPTAVAGQLLSTYGTEPLRRRPR